MTDHPVLLGCCCPALGSSAGLRAPQPWPLLALRTCPRVFLLPGCPERRLAGVSTLQPRRSRSWPRLREEGGPTPESAGRRRGSRRRAARARAADNRRRGGGRGASAGPRPPPPCKMAAARRPRDGRWPRPRDGRWPRPRSCAAPPCGGAGGSLWGPLGEVGTGVAREPWGGFALGLAEAGIVAAFFCPEVTF